MNPTQKLLELINKLSKVIGFKKKEKAHLKTFKLSQSQS